MNLIIRKKPLTFVLYYCVLLITTVTSQAGVQDEIEQHVIAFQEKNSSGGSYAVTLNRELLYSGGTGKANLELLVPSNNETVFRITSTTKQFTSAAIMMLQAQNNRTLILN